ncbi:MAG: hypothetical protein AB7P04_11615 [Bacteriovoracia bacterium]
MSEMNPQTGTAAARLKPSELAGLNKLGDIIIPGDESLPSFSKCGCAEHAPLLLAEIPASDRADLQSFLGILAMLPTWLVRVIVWLMEKSGQIPGPLGPPLRFLKMGIKGFVFSLYYSGLTGKGYRGHSSLEILDYHVDVYVEDLK